MVKLIEGSDEVRVQKCGQAIQQILDKFDCTLIPQLHIIAGNTQHAVSIVAKSREVAQGRKITLSSGMKLE
jgi:CO dehydrogenase/acetyl-CoA synthase delta subunit